MFELVDTGQWHWFRTMLCSFALLRILNRTLDFEQGVLVRKVEPTSPAFHVVKEVRRFESTQLSLMWWLFVLFSPNIVELRHLCMTFLLTFIQLAGRRVVELRQCTSGQWRHCSISGRRENFFWVFDQPKVISTTLESWLLIVFYFRYQFSFLSSIRVYILEQCWPRTIFTVAALWLAVTTLVYNSLLFIRTLSFLNSKLWEDLCQRHMSENWNILNILILPWISSWAQGVCSSFQDSHGLDWMSCVCMCQTDSLETQQMSKYCAMERSLKS